MPLQWLPLDQSIYNKSPISEAIRGGQSGGQPKAPSRQFLGTQDTTNYALERMKQEWAMEDKKKKEERDAAMEKAQEMGLRIMAAKEKEKAQYQQMAQQQQKQQMQQVQQIEENPEPAAKELFQFMQTVEPEVRERLLNELFTPIKTGSITMGDKTMETPSRYNPIAQEFINNGWVTFNPKTGEPEFSMPQREFEKGTYQFVTRGNQVVAQNTAEGTEKEIGKVPEEPIDVDTIYKDVLERGEGYIKTMMERTWEQDMSIKEAEKFTEQKKQEYRKWVAGQLYAASITDYNLINELADLAVGEFDWESKLKPPSDKPLNEEVANAMLKDAVSRNITQDPKKMQQFTTKAREQYGDATVDRFLKMIEERNKAQTPEVPTLKEGSILDRSKFLRGESLLN